MRHKKIIISIIAVVLLATVAYGSTLAWLTDTDEVQNTISLGEVKTELREESKEGDGTFKRSYIENMSEVSPCLVRARVTISPAEVAPYITFTGMGDGWKWNNWSNGDYVKYEKILEAKAATTYIFEGINIDEDRFTADVISALEQKGITTFDITVYEESVQAVVWDGNTEISAITQNADGSISYNTENADEIWNIYDSKTE